MQQNSSRVLHLVEHLHLGGIERLLEQIAANTQDPRATIFCTYETKALSGLGLKIQEQGYDVFTFKKAPGTDLKLIGYLYKLIRREQITVIHTHDFGPTEYAFYLKILMPSLKLVHTQHTLHHFVRNKKYTLFFGFVSNFYTHIISVSKHVQATLIATCPLLNKKHFKVVYNGIDTNRFNSEIAATNMNEKLNLVSICRISAEKNLDYILFTLKQLKEASIPFHFHHAGSGKTNQALNELKAKAESLGLRDHVTFYGFQENPKPVLEKGDIFVSSSLTEGHPVAVLEAMSLKRLCILSDIPAHREIKTGAYCLFDLKNTSALFEILKNLYLSKATNLPQLDHARSYVVNEFSIETMVSKYAKLY